MKSFAKKKFELKNLEMNNSRNDSKSKENLNFQEFIHFDHKSEKDEDKDNSAQIHDQNGENEEEEQDEPEKKEIDFSLNFNRDDEDRESPRKSEKEKLEKIIANSSDRLKDPEIIVEEKAEAKDNTEINDKSNSNLNATNLNDKNSLDKSQVGLLEKRYDELSKASTKKSNKEEVNVKSSVKKNSNPADARKSIAVIVNNFGNKQSNLEALSDRRTKEEIEKAQEEEKLKAMEAQRAEFNKQKLIKVKLEQIELNELMESNLDKIKQCQEQLYYDSKEKNELITYVQATGNLDTRKRDFPSYIILPNSRFRRYWDIIILLCAMYSIIMIPIDVGWNISCVNSDIKSIFDTFDLIIGVLFLTDVGINFITAILDEKFRYIFNIKDICIRYISTLFLFDIISAMPYSFFIQFNDDDCFDPSKGNPKLILLLGLFRMIKQQKMFTVLEELFSRYATIIRLLKLFMMVLYFAHCTGNILVGNSTTYADIIFRECMTLNSIEEIKTCRGNIVRTRFGDVYTYSVYTGYFIITGNETHLKENWEKMYFVIILVVSMGLTASIFGNVAILISNMSFGVSPVVQEKIDVMKEYMAYMKYDKPFIDTIETYHVNIWSKQRTMLYSEDFFADLNSSLLKMILIDQWKPTFFVIGKWLSLFSNQFFLNMIPQLKPKIFMKKDIIITEGDSTQDLYFISSTGQVSVKISGQWVKNMKGGEMFGEIAIFLRSRRRTASVTSLNDSDYLVLAGYEYENSLRDFPDTCQKIKEIGINRLMSSIKLYPSFVFAKLVPKNDLKDYLIRKSIYLEDYEEDELFSKKKDNAEQMINLDKYEKDFHQVKSNLKKACDKMHLALESINSQLVVDEEEVEEADDGY